MPIWTPGQDLGGFIGANDVARGAMGLQQPYVPPAPPRGIIWSGAQPGRPYAGVGKNTIGIGAGPAEGETPPSILEGFGAGAGRMIGGFFDKPGTHGTADTISGIGKTIGSALQGPVDLAAGALNAIPAIPGLPGYQMPGASLASMTDQQRQDVMNRWDGNPFSLFRLLGDVDKEDFQRKIESGEISAMLRPLGPASSLGEQMMSTLGVLGVGSNLLQRGYAGADDNGIKRVLALSDEELGPQMAEVRQRYLAGEVSHDQFLDAMVENNMGYSNDWWVNLALSMVLDPANLALGAGTAVGLATKGAKAARAAEFVASLSEEAATSLADDVARKALSETGQVLGRDAITGQQLFDAAVESGKYTDEIAAAASRLPAHSRFALTPGVERLEGVADMTARILDPFNNIGRMGTKPLQNAYLSREATKGVAMAYGLPNYTTVAGRMDELGLGGLFNESMGYFSSQEAVFMAGDSLRQDVQSIRRISSARPTDVALARAQVGAENFAQRMERWVGNRKADLGRLSGMGTAEQSFARAQSWATNRLTKMGLTPEQAAGVIKGLDGDGLSMIDAMYFGFRIRQFNRAKRVATEAIASRVTSKGKVSKRATEEQALVDRATLIGPRELTDLRAKAVREALDANDATAVRDAIRKYDRLSAEFLADGPTDSEILAGVRSWLDEFEEGLTQEVPFDRLPKELADDARRMDDGYIYGLRPEGDAEWRLAFDEDGNVKHANPWIDIVGDAAQPWNIRFGGTGRVQNLMGSMEVLGRRMTQQITTDRIDRETRQSFIRDAMNGVPGSAQTKGLTYDEANALFKNVKQRALEAGTTPRGLNLGEYAEVLNNSAGAKAAGLEARDLMLLTLQSYEGRLGTVGLTQKFTGQVKTTARSIPFVGDNVMGQMAERMFPLVRFTLNPFFQLQEWVEPWMFSAARGRMAMHAGKKGWVNPITGEVLTLDDVDALGQHLIGRYRAASPEAQFDMMERSLVYLHNAKAAKMIRVATGQGPIGAFIDRIGSPGARKEIAQNIQFRDQLGVLLKQQFDTQIGPKVWEDLEKVFGTTDQGTIAMRWLLEKSPWASADPAQAYHSMAAARARHVGQASRVSIRGDAQFVFNTTPEALILDVKRGVMDQGTYSRSMLDYGAHPEYVEKAWKNLQFEARTGGVNQWWDDYGKVFGEEAGKQARSLIRVLSEVDGVSESELLSRTFNSSPVSLLHDDLIGMAADDLAAHEALFQQGVAASALWQADEAGNLRYVPYETTEEGERAFMERAAKPPSYLPAEDAAMAPLEKVTFGSGRSVLIPGGAKALADPETPWTMWEAHVLRSQMIDPVELGDATLKHALYEKMWRGHIIDMTDPTGQWRTFNNTVMAMLSGGMNLTRNEAIATRFRVNSMDDLVALADDARNLRRTIEQATGEAAEQNEIGFAYSTRPDVAHYIPLDNREAYYRDAMLPEHQRLKKAGTGLKQAEVPEQVQATQGIIEERATAANAYLDGTTQTQRTLHATLEAEGLGGRMLNWATDEIAKAIERDGTGALDRMPAIVRAVRPGKVTDHEAVTKAAIALVADPEDRAARAVLQKLTGAGKYDADIAWKGWNVHGAGLPHAKMPDGRVTGHGDAGLYAYIKNPDVVWRGFGTNPAMGRALAMAEDFTENPDWFVRRVSQPTAPARFGEDVRGNATVPRQFKSEEGYVYRTVSESRKLSDWRVGEYAAKHPATIYATGDNSIVLRTRQTGDWEDAVGGVGADQNIRSRTGVSATEVEMLADDGTWVPVHQTVGGVHEPLDEFAERMLHRTNGLSLKTGYFGIDLGNPVEFNRGVMDTHMVGELVEYKRGLGGAAWDEFYGALGPSMKKQVDDWIAKGEPKGAGVFGWDEATGPTISFKGGTQQAMLDAAIVSGDYGSVARWVRGKIETTKVLREDEKARLLRMYRDDYELASLYGRDIQTLGGDYRLFDDAMSEHRMAKAAAGEPGLDRHGNGGYQWKLWDDRRHVYDPELSVYARAHYLPRKAIKFMATSDDINYAAGMMEKGGLQPITEMGYRYLDPGPSILAQMGSGASGSRIIRGATMWDDAENAIIGATQYRDATTGLHELTHAVIAPRLDESGRRVVLDDLNQIIRRQNDEVVVQTAEAQARLDTLVTQVAEHESALLAAQRELKDATSAATKATRSATKAEDEARDLTERVAREEGVLKEMERTAAQRRRDIERQKMAPSIKTRRLEAVDNGLTRQRTKVADLTTARDEATAAVQPAWDEVAPLKAAAESKAEDVRIINENLTARKAEGDAAKREYDDLATRPPRDIKYGWDREAEEHLADEFAVWLATGKARNSKLRDLFAYMRKALMATKEWLDGGGRKVSPAMDELFQRMTKPEVESAALAANAVPFDRTQEMMHAAAVQAVTDAEDAAFTNVQFRRGRSWLERSVNHPYFGIYPASYMWGKVAPEMIRTLAINPFGLPVPFLTKPVKIGGIEYGLHGSPFMGYVNAQRVHSAVELEKDQNPEFNAQVNDPQNDKVFRNFSMFLPGTPWDLPANYPLWMRRFAEWGLDSEDRAHDGRQLKSFDVPKTAGEVVSYAFGPKATLDWVSDTMKGFRAPMFSGESPDNSGLSGLSGDMLDISGDHQATEDYLRNAYSQLQGQFGGAAGQTPQPLTPP